MKSLRLAILLSLLPLALLAQDPVRLFAPFMSARAVTDSTLVINPTHLVSLDSNTDGGPYVTGSFTATSNSLLLLNTYVSGGSSTAITSITNSGPTNLVWWRVGTTNPASGSVGIGGLFATQLPQGTSSFAMTVTMTCSGSPIGASIHIWEVTNANTSALWGTNAVRQVKLFAPGNSSFTNTFDSDVLEHSLGFGGHGGTGASPPTPRLPWRRYLGTTRNTPFANLNTHVLTNLTAGTHTFCLTNGVSNGYTWIAEIR